MDVTDDRNKRTSRNFLIIFSNSLSWLVIAFLFMYLITQFATAIAAMQFDYPSIIYYYSLTWNIDSRAWTPDAVKMLYSIAPALGMFLGIMALLIYIQMYDALAISRYSSCGALPTPLSGRLAPCSPAPSSTKALAMW